jgi:hypothetical protein
VCSEGACKSKYNVLYSIISPLPSSKYNAVTPSSKITYKVVPMFLTVALKRSPFAVRIPRFYE